MRRVLPLAGLLCALLLTACAETRASAERMAIHLASPDGPTFEIQAELARTPEQQERGLMGRTSLPQGEGMLFIFPRSQILAFWMKDTLIPLEVLFFDETGQFVSAGIMLPCAPTESRCPSYASRSLARYGLELPIGSIRRFGGVGEGWRLQLGSWATP